MILVFYLFIVFFFGANQGYYVILYYVMLCYIILYYTLLYLYYIVLYYIVLYYIILYYIYIIFILYYITLYYIICQYPERLDVQEPPRKKRCCRENPPQAKFCMECGDPLGIKAQETWMHCIGWCPPLLMFVGL